jgi:hypothetical protein
MKTQFKTLVIAMSFATLTACHANSKTNTSYLAISKTVIGTNSKSEKPEIKVALLLDTSNSMDGLIDQAKAQLWENYLMLSATEKIQI